MEVVIKKSVLRMYDECWSHWKTHKLSALGNDAEVNHVSVHKAFVILVRVRQMVQEQLFKYISLPIDTFVIVIHTCS
jgi:hypothetical protein